MLSPSLPAPPRRKRKTKPGTCVLVVPNVPEVIRANFKMACARKRESMHNAIVNLMKTYSGQF